MEIKTGLYQPTNHTLGDFIGDLPESADLVFAFGDYEFIHRPQVLSSLRQRWPHAAMLGCSTAGEIHGGEVSDGSLAVAAVRLRDTKVRSAVAKIDNETDSYRAGAEVAVALNGADLRGVFIVAEGVTVNRTALVRGVAETLGDGVVVGGGFAGDSGNFSGSWVLRDGVPTSGYVTAVGFYGNRFHFNSGCDAGWESYGAERRVTRSKDSVLYELDGKPALQVYKEYLGVHSGRLPESGFLFPFGMRAKDGDAKSLVRTVLSVDEADQSMTFAGAIPEGCLAQLMRANFDRLVDAASNAGRAALPTLTPIGDTLSVAVSCIGRRLVLGERVEDETEAALNAQPVGTHQIGFFSYGEIAPHVSRTCDLHNQTMTVATMCEV